MPASPVYKYYIKKSTDANYSTTPTYEGAETTYTFSGLTHNTEYDVKIEVADRAGNVGEATVEKNKTTESTTSGISLNGTVSQVAITEGQAELKITGELTLPAGTVGMYITKVELYEGTTKVKEFTYTEATTQIEQTYKTEYMAFYEEKSYTAKIIAQDTANTVTTQTSILKVANTDTIKTETDLKNFANAVNSGTTFEGKTIKQIATITLSTNHIAIGTAENPFKGTFNGNNYTISGIKIDNTENYQGLIGYASGANISNVKIENVNIVSNNYTGTIVGYIASGNISNCTITGSIDGEEYVGGLCGYATSSNITNCGNSSSVNGSNYIGGIVGYSYNTIIFGAYNKGTIDGGERSGGIAGAAYGTSNSANKIYCCYNTGGVTNSFLARRYSGSWR